VKAVFFFFFNFRLTYLAAGSATIEFCSVRSGMAERSECRTPADDRFEQVLKGEATLCVATEASLSNHPQHNKS